MPERYELDEAKPQVGKDNIFGEFACPKGGQEFVQRHLRYPGHHPTYVERYDGLECEK